jgi:U3 small nucleolar RNA-associated protein 20
VSLSINLYRLRSSYSLSTADHDCLTQHLLSANSSLRKAILQVLAANVPVETTAQKVWAACLQVEASEMTLKNVRERTSNIGKLGRLLEGIGATEEKELVEDATRYLVSQLKVNFRPLYPDTIAALAGLGSSRGESLWGILWAQLQKTISAESTHAVDLDWEEPAWTREAGATSSARDDDFDEEDAEFRCPNLNKGRRALSSAWVAGTDPAAMDPAQEIQVSTTVHKQQSLRLTQQVQISPDRLDVINYETQLLAVLASAHSLAEKHSRLLVPVFLSMAQRDPGADQANPALAGFSTRQLQNRTIAFLELFTHFVNPKAFYRADEVYALYLDIVSRGEVKLQSLAVKCLMTYKSPKLLPYGESLQALLEDSKFRDELVNLNLSAESEAIDPQHREEIMPVAIRLLYGVLISKRGRSSSQGLGARKQAILTALSGCNESEYKTLIDLMLDPFMIKGSDAVNVNVPGRQQSGFLTLLHDMTRYLGPQTVAYWPRLLKTVIALVDNAQTQLGKVNAPVEVVGEEVEEVEDEEVEADKGAAPLRSIRTAGIKRIVQFVRAPTDFDFKPYLHDIFVSIISPRLDKLEIENTQAPSGTLDLIAALAASPSLAPSLVDEDERTLVKTFACLTAVKVKPAVIARVFDVVEHLLADADDAESHKTLTKRVLVPKVRSLLDNIIRLVPILSGQADDELLKRLLGILSRLAAIITDGQQAQQLASLLGPMLKLPGKKLPEKGKTNVLVTLQKLYAVAPDFQDPSSVFFSQTYNLISNLYQTVWLPPTRKALVQVHQTFAAVDPLLHNVIRISTEINAYSERRKEEPDFDRRLSAFAEINDVSLDELPKTTREWLPLLRNGLFYLLEQEELSIRTNASNLLQRYITLVGEQSEGPMVDMLQQVIMPGLRKTFKHKAELVRNEALQVLAHAVKTCTGVPVLVEMQPLLGGDDDELNFFTNVSHIQVHRRARALRRLRDVVAESDIREQTTSTVFMPVLEHIISGSTDITDHHLVNEAITTTGALTGHLVWSRYNATVMRFLKLGSVKTNQQKFYIRTVSAILDHFQFDLKAKVLDIEEPEVAEEDDDVMELDEGVEPEVKAKSADSRFSTALITDVIIHRLLPALSKFAESKDETEDNIRVPVSLGIVKLAHALPGEHATNEITRIVTSTSNVLKSKDQDTRDIARDTICKIALFLGPDWLVRVIKELRTALFRGPQKHVLAVTIHAILVQATSEPDSRFSDLDDAVEDAVQISAEVVWGESGKDVVADGFKTKMREVRGANSRGLDTFQLVARLVSPSKLSAMLAPVREVMHASQAIKTMLQVDEALRRISLGLNANNRLGPEDVLLLCFSLISGNSSYIQPKRKAPKSSLAADSYRVQMKRKDKEEEDFYPLNAYKFIAFGLDLFVTAFKRGRFDFDNVDILARLGPLVPVVGNTLYSATAGVLLLGLKATAAIVRCPVSQVEESVPVFVNNIFRVIKNAGGTAESDVAQTALKTLAVILRDNKTSNITEKQLRYLLEVISPDIEETDRQSAIFTILRSIVGRKFVVPEIYDLMDRVSAIMVTNQSTHVQELCRGVLMAFLLDYPQGAGRLKAQMTFLARNLSYQFESGRISVLEVLSAVLTKFSDDLVHEYADMLFVSLVAVLANDDSEKCRAMAGVLIKMLFGRLGEQQKSKTLQVLRSWVELRDQQASLASASLAVYAIVLESAPDAIAEIVNVVVPAVVDSAHTLQSAESSEDDIHLEHQVALNALKALVRALEVSPSATETLPWEAIVQHLLFPHTGVRLAAARCVSILLTSTPEKEGFSGLEILGEEALLDIARKSCLLMKGDETDEGRSGVVDPKLADVLVKILWQISKHWAVSLVPARWGSYVLTKQASHTVANGTVVEEAVEEEEDDEEEPAFVKARNSTKPLAWLMSRMSYLARHLIVHRPSANANLFTVVSPPEY